jgi:hypothetical protein
MRTNSETNENDIMDMIIYNNNEYNPNCSTRTLKTIKIKRNKFFNNGLPINFDDDNELINFYRKRSNSVDLYKKHKLKKKKENNNINTNINNDKVPENLDDNRNKINEESNNINTINGKKVKKVTFLQPKFVTIIDVESYKQFNASNTCKDPFEDYFKNNNNIKNNTNANSNKDKKIEDNERVVCSCTII